MSIRTIRKGTARTSEEKIRTAVLSLTLIESALTANPLSIIIRYLRAMIIITSMPMLMKDGILDKIMRFEQDSGRCGRLYIPAVLIY